jgi:hypothetical protein
MGIESIDKGVCVSMVSKVETITLKHEIRSHVVDA